MKWKATLQIKQKEITENTFNGKHDNSLKEEEKKNFEWKYKDTKIKGKHNSF